MKNEPRPNTDLILYQTEDGRTRIQCRFENETVWLSQALIAELFQKDVRTINEHLLNIFEEGELRRGENGFEAYVMIEIPSNVILAEKFADLFDGFSIGSNDLTQLTLGVDRKSTRLNSSHL